MSYKLIFFLLYVSGVTLGLWLELGNTRWNSVIQYLKEVVVPEAGKSVERIQNRMNL